MIDLKFWKNKGSADDAAESPQALTKSKKMLGSFEVVSELGRGSMGMVYQGKDAQSGRSAAIKTITLTDDFGEYLEDAKSQFMREVKIMIWLDHPDIITVYDVGQEHGLLYIAMEYFEGVKMSEFTTRSRLRPLAETLEIIARVADALGYAHEQNIVHCDIKPENIMYDAKNNAIRVIDFGISRLIFYHATRSGLVIGSPAYMSPEQIRKGHIDGRSDLFSLGATLYQLVSGRLPFKGDSKTEMMNSIVSEPHIDILQVNPDLPCCMVDIINRALNKDVEGRFQSGQEMATAIRKCSTMLHIRGTREPVSPLT